MKYGAACLTKMGDKIGDILLQLHVEIFQLSVNAFPPSSVLGFCNTAADDPAGDEEKAE